MRPYADYAAKYLEAGYFPIPAQGKRVIKNSHHGRDKPLVTGTEVAKWSRLHPQANIAARLPRDVIGIDVDAYGEKPGEETLARLEEILGPLPATILSTSRDDWVSGIRLFRIPQHYWSVIWPGKAGEGIDIIWHGNRYMIVWPSVHPDTGLSYRWYDQNEDRTLDELKLVPDLSDDWLPDFPKDWCDYFARVDQGNELADVADTADWIKSHGAGVRCDMMQSILDRMADAIVGDAHGSTSEALFAIAREMLRGHPGGSAAIAIIRKAFFEEVDARPADRKAGARSEWRRMVDGAVRKAEAQVKEQERSNSDPCSDDDISLIQHARPVRGDGGLLWADDVVEERLDWLHKPLFPFGSLVILDGDPAQGKTLQTQTWAVQASLGLPLVPYGEHCGRAIKCGIIGAEDDLGTVVMGRLRAAGWERGSRSIAFQRLKRDKRGKVKVLMFPDGVELVRSFIVNGGLEFVIIDPITAFLGEDIKSHVDASVRGALGPLGDVARETGCCILMVRHLNKSGDMKAMYRGGGSIAFSAIARSGLITGQIPDSEDGRFGLAQVKVNSTRRMPVTLSYSIQTWQEEEDSDIPIIQWHGEAELSADQLVSGPAKKPGPSSTAQDEVEAVLLELFRQRDEWPAQAIAAELRAAGCSLSNNVIEKVKKRLNIRSRKTFPRGKLEGKWVWTMAPERHRGSRSSDE